MFWARYAGWMSPPSIFVSLGMAFALEQSPVPGMERLLTELQKLPKISFGVQYFSIFTRQLLVSIFL